MTRSGTMHGMDFKELIRANKKLKRQLAQRETTISRHASTIDQHPATISHHVAISEELGQAVDERERRNASLQHEIKRQLRTL